MKKKIVVFASGGGSNFEVLAENCRNGNIDGQIALLVVSKKTAGAAAKAQKYNIPVITAEENAEAALKKIQPHLICLAGYLQKIPASILNLAPVMNIHPALLPAFGGKGMYGERVHKAVLDSGCRVTGVTVHFIDGEYDKGVTIMQRAVPVFETDTAQTLAARVLQTEHSLYPLCVKLFCDGRIKVTQGKAEILKENAPGVRRALISVSDKTSLADFAKGLHDLGIELVSTSGTAKFLKEQGLPVRDLSSLTNFPEILEGRVKTLHPHVHGGILFKRDNPSHAAAVENLGIEPIDMLVVNLYPFRETAAKAKESFAPEVIENIDIGGPSMIRSAAKNFKDVAVLCRTVDYEPVLKELKDNHNTLSYPTRQRLCVEAFTHTAEYDAAISEEFKKGLGQKYPESKIIVLKKLQSLRYGENPHQQAALYSREPKFAFEQLHGKELSYNNILDAFGTWDAAAEYTVPACVIFKHITPCGIGTGKNLAVAFERAWASDPKSAYGGVISVNRPLTGEIAEVLSKYFVEIICAPGFDADALEILKQKKNLRLLKRTTPPSTKPTLKSVGDEVLLQEPNLVLFKDAWRVASKRAPSKEEETALKFAWSAVKHIKSNAIVLASPSATAGIGAGQMSRVDAVKMAGMKYEEYLKNNKKPKTLVLGSDAFFPFRDGVDEAAKLGVTAVIQPGGSIRDEDVIKACDELGIALVLTGLRHFRH